MICCSSPSRCPRRSVCWGGHESECIGTCHRGRALPLLVGHSCPLQMQVTDHPEQPPVPALRLTEQRHARLQQRQSVLQPAGWGAEKSGGGGGGDAREGGEGGGSGGTSVALVVCTAPVRLWKAESTADRSIQPPLKAPFGPLHCFHTLLPSGGCAGSCLWAGGEVSWAMTVWDCACLPACLPLLRPKNQPSQKSRQADGGVGVGGRRERGEPGQQTEIIALGQQLAPSVHTEGGGDLGPSRRAEHPPLACQRPPTAVSVFCRLPLRGLSSSKAAVLVEHPAKGGWGAAWNSLACRPWLGPAAAALLQPTRAEI